MTYFQNDWEAKSMSKKTGIMAIIFVLTATALSAAFAAQAINHGVEKIGTTYPISEEHAIHAIERILREKQQSGELEAIQQQVQERINHAALNLDPVEGLDKTQKPSVRYFEPTYTVPETILDQDGNVIALAGTVIKPLQIAPIAFALFFFDGRDEAQIQLAKQLQQQYGETFMPILIAGSWYELSAQLNQAVYYDQQGRIAQSVDLREVPALVQQENDLLRIETFKPW